ncbi:hypothetical protein HOC01_05970 [archaeon]|jgi:citryl-CoA synthetase large subunit|nr:hypothetical protein [archaeon]MBT6697611.1 hypothetical protein [archaeon]
MKLKEFEGKKLFDLAGISVSSGVLVKSVDDVPEFSEPKMFKVQVVSNGRAKAGGVFVVSGASEARLKAKEFLGSEFLGEKISEILLDEKIDIAQELYLGILFDTKKRVPVFIFSSEGGVDIEELRLRNPEKIKVREIDMFIGLSDEDCLNLIKGTSLENEIISELVLVMKKLWDCFVRFDCKMLEINPLVVDSSERLVAVDSVVVIDDDANYRREIKFAKRVDSREKTSMELKANAIDENDSRGVAGKTFIELNGDIGVLTSGGGASMTLMDTLLEVGGKAANFTEYSGDPSREKVQNLTRVVLSKKGLSGLIVAGAIANFTNIKETLTGVADVLIEVKPDFPIVIRRAGPYDKEAKEMLASVKEKHGLDIHYFDETVAMTKAASIMVDLSKKYKLQKEKGKKEEKGVCNEYLN